ncbi:MAG TPA: YncE family protein [Bryobacteraceae bacterium]|nr:YncE family protein [Bryobacteraceae bacterium]
MTSNPLAIAIALSAFAITGGCASKSTVTSEAHAESKAAARAPLPGMPPVLDPLDIYSADRANQLSPAVAGFPSYIYVPNSGSNTVDIIDPKTYKIVKHFAVGRQPQHVVPSWDMKHLWVLNDLSDSVTHIDPATGAEGKTIHVEDPYNMYFTPDGKYAIVVAERLRRLDFRNPNTMKLEHTTKVDCRGVDHLDFSADGTYFIASCEFSGELLKVDVATRQVTGKIQLSPHAMPQDVKLSPDGKVFYIADMHGNGLYLVDGESFKVISFLPTGKGTHGLYASRDSKVLYISNRGEGSVSVLDFATRAIKTKWELPKGGSPDMGGVSADGKVLWLAGRYHHEVYAIDTNDGKLLARIKVGKGPHGLCVYPQPGRYSLGHTGVFR